jgi:hypothetical protein
MYYLEVSVDLNIKCRVTYIVATMIVGTIRSGTTSKMNLERSHEVGLRG